MRNWGGALAETRNFRTVRGTPTPIHAEQLAAGRHCPSFYDNDHSAHAVAAVLVIGPARPHRGELNVRLQSRVFLAILKRGHRATYAPGI
jgi:hypothetical protein